MPGVVALPGLAAGANVAAGADVAPSAKGVNPRTPNILVIMSDEHNASVLGCYGNRIVRTPNLDRLAERGIVFERAYTNSPLCVPSRLAFTAGKYVSRIGAWNNDCRLPTSDFPSLPRILNAAGYESFLCGKMHYDATCRYGFTEIGGNMNAAHMTGLGSRRKADNLPGPPGLSDRFAQFHPGTGPGMRHDQRVVAGAVEFLANRGADRRGSGDPAEQKPFFLVCGFITPHFPLIVPESYWEPYKGRVPMPILPPGHLESLPLNYQHLRAGFQIEHVPPETVRKGRELYYGLTQWMDEQVGTILKTLADRGLADNTIVIYTSDHGENMGEHGLWWKNCVYEHAARVPLIISWPARWKGGQRRAGASSAVDLVQTIAELGGAKAPADWNGTSMCRWMDNPATPWKDLAVSEYYAHNIASGYATLRAGRYKYVYHASPDAQHPAQRELYDLESDPGEFVNLAGRAQDEATVRRMHATLVKELGEDPESIEKRCRADIAKGYGEAPKAKKAKAGKKKAAAI
jgi:choline-sulfatase